MGWAANGRLSESGFIGLADFQDSPDERLRRTSDFPRSAWRDFPLRRKTRAWAKRNPENPLIRQIMILTK